MKKALKILRGVFVAIASLLFACWILLQTPAAQTFVTRKVVASLEGVLNGRIEISKIHLRPFNALVLKDVAIIDSEPVTDWDGEEADTLASAGSIVATFSLKGLRNDGAIHIRRLNISDASFSLAKDERGGSIKRIFKSSDEKRKASLSLWRSTPAGSGSETSGSGSSTRPKTVRPATTASTGRTLM